MTDDEALDAAAFGPENDLRTPDPIILRAVKIARERGAALDAALADRERTMHVLLDLQRMAAEKYAYARDAHGDWIYCRSSGYTWRQLERPLWATVRAQEEAARFSKLVRVGLGIEEP